MSEKKRKKNQLYWRVFYELCQLSKKEMPPTFNFIIFSDDIVIVNHAISKRMPLKTDIKWKKSGNIVTIPYTASGECFKWFYKIIGIVSALRLVENHVCNAKSLPSF